MPGPNMVLDKGFKCMSTVSQFTAVKLVTTAKEQVTAITAATDTAIGFAQEALIDPVRVGKQVVNVRMHGISEVVAGGVIAIGDKCILDAAGRVVTAGAAVAGTQIVGTALTASAALGDWIDLNLSLAAKV